MKCAVAFSCVWALLGLASLTAVAQTECDPTASTDLSSNCGQTGEAWWNQECKDDWASSAASSSCTITSDGEPKHVRIEDDYNICWLKAECFRSFLGNAWLPIINEFEGRNVDVRNLKDCNGSLSLEC